MKNITGKMLKNYREYLAGQEKSEVTCEKYLRDVNCFKVWSGGKSVDKSLIIEFKDYLIEKYAPASVNSIISSLNSFFEFAGWQNLKLKNVKIQRQIFSGTDKELTKPEYEKLLTVAQKKKNERLFYLMQTICSTGIRVSELKYITIEAINCAKATINCKGKLRYVFIPEKLCKMLKKYAKERKIKSGAIFISRNGKPLDRSNIWHDMKKLCAEAEVPEEKVFPHNLRHLFARTFYSIQKDIVRLADILGHSSVNTTRIYTMESGEIHRKQLQMLGLLRC